jgi:hypothetical protein
MLSQKRGGYEGTIPCLTADHVWPNQKKMTNAGTSLVIQQSYQQSKKYPGARGAALSHIKHQFFFPQDSRLR